MRFFTTKVCSVRFLALQEFVVYFPDIVCSVLDYVGSGGYGWRIHLTSHVAIAASLVFDMMHKLSFTLGKANSYYHKIQL